MVTDSVVLVLVLLVTCTASPFNVALAPVRLAPLIVILPPSPIELTLLKPLVMFMVGGGLVLTTNDVPVVAVAEALIKTF